MLSWAEENNLSGWSHISSSKLKGQVIHLNELLSQTTCIIVRILLTVYD